MQYQAYEFDSLDLNPDSPFFWDHLSRYWWSTEFLAGKIVLDCACGKGYGSYVLSQTAKFVYGIDLNQQSLQLAQENFGARKNTSFSSFDVTKIHSFPQELDAVVAFEVIEHLPPDSTHSFLQGIRQKLGEQGVLYLSTPNHDVVTKSGVYVPDFHINNFRPRELEQALRQHFQSVTLLGQFLPKPAWQQLLFDFDYWNLRHQLPKRSLAQRYVSTNNSGLNSPKSKPLITQSADPALPRQPAKSVQSWQHFLEVYPEEAKAYRFSPKHWRQAGLTVAIAHNRKV
jgi:2-polyprenyl-3-methyl-5-hydroxy-6-metoxy-1,4-benzoquinol methylase